MFGFTRKRDLEALDNRIFKLEFALTRMEYRLQQAQASADDAQSRLGALGRYLKVRFRTTPARGPQLEAYSDDSLDAAVEDRRFISNDFIKMEQLLGEQGRG